MCGGDVPGPGSQPEEPGSEDGGKFDTTLAVRSSHRSLAFVHVHPLPTGDEHRTHGVIYAIRTQ